MAPCLLLYCGRHSEDFSNDGKSDLGLLKRLLRAQVIPRLLRLVLDHRAPPVSDGNIPQPRSLLLDWDGDIVNIEVRGVISYTNRKSS